MNDFPKEIESSSIPLFMSPLVQVKFAKLIQKVNRHGASQARVLAITNYCLLILRKKSFPSSLKASHTLLYNDLQAITVIPPDQIELHFHHSKYHIKYSNPEEIAELISQVHDSLYSPINMKGFTPKAPVISPHVLSDRILSFAVGQLTLQTIEALADFSHFIQTNLVQSEKNDYSLIFTPELVASPFFQSFVQALSIKCSSDEQYLKISQIELRKTSLHSIATPLGNILAANPHINTVIFDQTSFIGLTSLARGYLSPSLTSLIFIQCNFDNDDSINLFNEFSAPYSQFCDAHPKKSKKIDFSQIKGVTSIYFHSCVFTSSSFQSLCSNLVIAERFSNINTYHFEDIHIDHHSLEEYMLQVIGFEWFSANKHIKDLRFISCDINSSYLLSNIDLQNTCLENISLQKSKMFKSITINNFGNLQHLSLSFTSFTYDSFNSFLNNLSKAGESCPAEINLSNLIFIDPKENKSLDYSFNPKILSLEELYESIKNISIPSLKSLSWASNIIPVLSLRNFFEFLKKQPNLTMVNLTEITNIDNPSKTETVAKTIATVMNDILPSTALEKMVIWGTQKSNYGPSFGKILEVLKNIKRIVGLDITGQSFGDGCVDILIDLVSNNLQEFVFDHSECSAPCFKKLIQAMTHSTTLTQSKWPEFDGETLEGLKTQFKSRFEHVRHEKRGRDISFMAIKKSVEAPIIVNTAVTNVNFDMENVLNDVAKEDQEITDILEECLPQSKGHLFETDVLVHDFKNYYGPFSIEEFTANLK